MTADNVTTAALVLLGTVTGALAGLGPALFLAEKAERRERGRELWRRDADLCGQLEQLAGEITERLSAWGVRPDEYDAIAQKTAEMGFLSGKFPRYPAIQRSIRDLHNTASRMWAARNHYDTQEERMAITAELQQRQAALLAACGHALGREAPMNRRSDK
jgi:hypothetical protein